MYFGHYQEEYYLREKFRDGYQGFFPDGYNPKPKTALLGESWCAVKSLTPTCISYLSEGAKWQLKNVSI
jgi:hypothetical protein